MLRRIYTQITLIKCNTRFKLKTLADDIFFYIEFFFVTCRNNIKVECDLLKNLNIYKLGEDAKFWYIYSGDKIVSVR